MSSQLTTPMSAADAQRAESGLRRLAPKWTTHVVHAIAKYGPEMRVADVAQQLPALSQQYVGKRLAAMSTAGLVMRDGEFDRTAPYRLSASARTLGPLYRTLAQWSGDHIDRTPQGRYDRIEDALHRLQLADTTETIRLLSEHGSLRLTHLAERLDAPAQFAATRLNRMQADGLVARTGNQHGAPYILTDAGRALGPVYAALQQWDHRHTTAAPPALRAADQALGARVPSARTAAALRRSAAPSALFSHAPVPQPRVPAAATAASRPFIGR
ncbi:winged helix-turn-helix transcriptional regulator [Streptomyces sp. MJM8645]|uniref:winged helix-turn-helix transcriptional regulator n=1 Tax=Streptomycetaceae TaxID=2062 RepID=UPI000AC78A93|nr:winged helix-turn-helix transcriptional regulator [Streptomyces sp. MJM8645]